MHADDFRQDRYGVVSGLRDGGYSDDMTLAAIAGSSCLQEVMPLLYKKAQLLRMKCNPVISFLCSKPKSSLSFFAPSIWDF